MRIMHILHNFCANVCNVSSPVLWQKKWHPLCNPSPYDLYCVGGTLSLTQSIIVYCCLLKTFSRHLFVLVFTYILYYQLYNYRVGQKTTIFGNL